MRTGLALFLAAALSWAGDDAAPERPRIPINKFFHGKVLRVKKGRVTLHYDFEKEEQLKDFEEWRPAHLLDGKRNAARIVAGRLKLARSSGLRHRMEGQGRIEARFIVSAKKAGSVGTILSEPLPSGTYVLTNIWDHRFHKNGQFSMLAMGLPGEGAGTIKGISFRELANVHARVVTPQIQPMQDCEMEFGRDGARVWTRLGIVHRQGDLKGNMRAMPRHHFGFWVHENDAVFDELVLTI